MPKLCYYFLAPLPRLHKPQTRQPIVLPKSNSSFSLQLNFVAACLARGRARQAWPKVLVYYHRVAGTAAPRYICRGRQKIEGRPDAIVVAHTVAVHTVVVHKVV